MSKRILGFTGTRLGMSLLQKTVIPRDGRGLGALQGLGVVKDLLSRAPPWYWRMRSVPSTKKSFLTTF